MFCAITRIMEAAKDLGEQEDCGSWIRARLSTSWDDSLGHGSGWCGTLTADSTIPETVGRIVARCDHSSGLLFESHARGSAGE